MGDVHVLLSKLTLNSLFVRDLMAATAPCFALGYVEERGSLSGFLALRPEQPIPSALSERGFSLGHCVLGLQGSPVLKFTFAFYDHASYHALVNPGNPMVQEVLSTMVGV